MPRHLLTSALLAVVLFFLSSTPAGAQEFNGRFSGFNEVGALNNETGAILSEGTGTLKLTLDKSLQTITFELTYSGLSAPVTQSHIHFGQVHTPGGIMVFLCTNLNNGPAGTQTCPSSSGTVTGTITAASVIAVPGQNVKAGDFDALTDALFSHTAYGNIHTAAFPAGEIRAQLLPERRGRDFRRRDGDSSGSNRDDRDHGR